MKTINEYLLSKNNAKANTVFLDINEGDVRTKQDVINFFEEKNFKQIHNIEYLEEFYNKFEKSSVPVYWIGSFSEPHDASNWVRFGKGGKISKSNPVMFWRVNDYRKGHCKAYFYATSKNIGEANNEINTFDEFKAFVNKMFENE